jgi:hypothetical protein
MTNDEDRQVRNKDYSTNQDNLKNDK